MINEKYQKALLTMVQKDRDAKEMLKETGALDLGYHRLMEKIHTDNKDELVKLIENYGFPGISLVGKEGNQAAFLVIQHAISHPAFFKEMFKLFSENQGDVHPVYLAYMLDRIAFYERRPQKYGTQFDYDADGEMNVWTLENPVIVDKLRADLGMDLLAERLAYMRANNAPITAKEAKRHLDNQMDWLKKTGWL